MPWSALAAVAWIGLAVLCVHLILGVTAMQRDLSRQIEWWRAARAYQGDVQRLAELLDERAWHGEAAALLDDMPKTLAAELEDHGLQSTVPILGAASLPAVARWMDAEAQLSEALRAVADDERASLAIVAPPAAQLSEGVAATMREVTEAMAARTASLDAQRNWLHLVAALSILGAGALIGLLHRNHRKRVALAASRGALQVSEARYRNMFQENRTVQLVVHPGTRRIVDANQAACAFYGADFERLTSMRLHDLLDRRAPIDPEDQRHDESGRPLLARHRLLDGDVRDVEVRSSPFEGHGRKLLYLIIHDVTERHRAERALAESEARLRATVSSMSEALLSVDGDGLVTFANAAAAELTGWDAEAMLGQRLAKVYVAHEERSGDDQRARIAALAQADAPGRPAGALRLTQRMGGERLVAEGSAPLRDERGRSLGAVIVLRDVTEQRKLEDEVLKSQKLDSLGVLAGGIAHDFNNILAGVFGHLGLVHGHLADQPDVAERVTKAEAACTRARELTQRLLTLSKGGSPVRKTASLGELVQESVEFALRGSNVRSEITVAEDLWTADVDKGQISQVLQNLVINADQAMPEGGTLEVVARNVEIGTTDVDTLAPGHYVEIAVHDTGVGIDPGDIDRIFDPYFTTKEKGSGLGLASSFSIVRNHEGSLGVASVLGEGTVFTVRLPASTGDCGEEELPTIAPPRGGAAVLLMDDDEEVLEVLAGHLAQLGCHVETTTHGKAALRRYERALAEGTPFDLVGLDLTVPGGMGALDTLDALQGVDPSVRAVLVTGYANHPAVQRPEAHGFCGSLTKPFTRDELAHLLGRALEGGTEQHAA